MDETFEHFAARCLPSLVRLAGVLAGDRGTAEEVVQEVLLRVSTRWAKIQLTDSPETYVRRMVVNEYLSWRRKWSRMVPDADVARMADVRPVPDHAERHAQRDDLSRRLDRLPARQRAVVVLRYYEGLSDESIARILGCSMGTGAIARFTGTGGASRRSCRRPPGGASAAHPRKLEGITEMATLDDLSATLVEREIHAPDPSSFVLTASETTRSRARWFAPALAAAAVLCLTMGSVAVGREFLSGGPDIAAGTGPGSELRWSFSVGTVPGYTIARSVWTTDLESATITSSEPSGAHGLIEIHAPGAVDDSRLVGQHVSVLGHRGIFQVGATSDQPEANGQPMLIWEYADNAWAEVGGTFAYDPATGNYDQQQALALELKIAAKLTFTDSDAVTAPFQASPPRELTLKTATTTSGHTCLAYDAPGTRAADGLTSAALTICRVPPGAATPVDTRPGDEVVTRDLDDGTRLVLVGASNYTGSLRQSEITAIAYGVDVSPRLGDSSSWLPVYAHH